MAEGLANVANVRRSLSHMRAAHAAATPAAPLYLSQVLPETGQTYSEWAFEFVRMHHRKRQIKAGKQ